MTASLSSLNDLLPYRTNQHGADRALVFLSDRNEEQSSLTYDELHQRSRVLARQLATHAVKGERVLLMLPTGSDFAIAFFACLAAGLIAVPIMPPRRLATRGSSERILADCGPRLFLTDVATMAGARADRLKTGGAKWIAIDELVLDASDGTTLPKVSGSDLAVLQYTSGSTSAPKGVMVTHANLLANLGMITQVLGSTRRSTYVNWGPLYHDMGLIGDFLEPLYVGALGVLMRPSAFMRRPLNWLHAIHTYGGEVAGGPNFAYELCVHRFRPELVEGLDLSRWKVAFNGAEPVRAATLEKFTATFAPYGFDARAHYPCFGMAEATLIIAGGTPDVAPVTHAVSRAGLQCHRASPPLNQADALTVVSCGRAMPGQKIAIVDPATATRLTPLEIGEIWISGPSITQGYWRNETATAASFGVRIARDDNVWMRTGDFGFLDEVGELVVTGRIKEMLIIRGMNHYPQDIEATAQQSHPALSIHNGVAFTLGQDDRLIIAHEVDRLHRDDSVYDDIVTAIREAIATEHELAVHKVLLLRPGALPKTTSGKVQRSLTRDLWRAGELELV